MLIATKIRIYPNDAQQQSLAVQFGCARWAYNNALAETQRLYRETGKGLSYFGLANRLPSLKGENEWLADADSQVLQSSLRNLTAAFQGFFERRGKYPRFKSKHSRQSIQYPQRVKLDGKRIYLPKVGWVKAVVHREIIGRVKTVTVSRNPCGHYYAAILTDDGMDMPVATMPEGGKFTGVDVGLIDFAVTSNGQHFANPRHLRKAERNLKRKQQKLSRKKKGSKSRGRAKKLVARCHERVANTRKDYLHKLSHKIVSESQAIAVEDLHVKGMLHNHSLAKAISEAGWGMFAGFCKYKAERAGKPYIKTGRFFPSSKSCSECGTIQDKMPLHVRRWTCVHCGAEHDRDENAAKNIGQEADRMLLAGLINAPGIGVSAGGGKVSRKLGRKPSVHAFPAETGSPLALAVG